MILIFERQMMTFKAYVPIEPMTQGRKGKILCCREGSKTGCRKATKKPGQAGLF